MPLKDPDKVSTLAVHREIADRVRTAARSANLSALEAASQLLEYALDHGELYRERVAIRTKDLPPPDPSKRQRGRPPKR